MELSAENINQIISTEKAFAILRLPNEEKLIVKAGNWERKKISELKSECFFVQPFSPNEKGFALMPLAKSEVNKKVKIKIPKETTKEVYLENFEKFKKEIQSEKASKLVLSKIKVGANAKINIGESFFSLCDKFPSAAINLFFIPDVGLWMGASPETLLKVDKQLTMSMSLAGTISSKEKKWTAKEKKEQQIVTDYIARVFGNAKNLKQTEEVLEAGNVQHLCTIFDIPTADLPKEWTKIVQDLHPTPAVNGFPKENALKFIEENEKHAREFYAGYFGMVHPNDSCHLFANIRCMKLVDSIPYIFTGGGITIDSEGEKEWEETELKALGLVNSLSVGEK